MKSCQVCSMVAEDDDAACFACGEASWVQSDVVVDAAPKKAKKQKATKPVEPVADDPVISDAEFASELATASDADLAALKADPRMSDAWLALVDAEIEKREAK